MHQSRNNPRGKQSYDYISEYPRGQVILVDETEVVCQKVTLSHLAILSENICMCKIVQTPAITFCATKVNI